MGGSRAVTVCRQMLKLNLLFIESRKRSKELQAKWDPVDKNRQDFTAWTYLLSAVEKEVNQSSLFVTLSRWPIGLTITRRTMGAVESCGIDAQR